MNTTPTPPVTLSISCPEGRTQSTQVRLSDGQALGCVQSVTWHLEVGSLATCTIRTVVTPAELTALKADTTIKVQMWDEEKDAAEAAKYAPIVERRKVSDEELAASVAAHSEAIERLTQGTDKHT